MRISARMDHVGYGYIAVCLIYMLVNLLNFVNADQDPCERAVKSCTKEQVFRGIRKEKILTKGNYPEVMCRKHVVRWCDAVHVLVYILLLLVNIHKYKVGLSILCIH